MAEGEIFIVDDNPNNLALLAGLLKDAGYKVRMANSGKRALQMLSYDPPELVMLDISVPEMDGYEVCARLKSDERTRAVPVLFISALDDVLDKVRAFKVGGIDCVTKPIEAEEVLARVESQLKIFRLQRELEAHSRQLERKNEELARAHRTTSRVFSALAEAHANRIVHRDVKPDNVFLHQTKRGEVVKVLDFGVAKLLEDERGAPEADLTGAGGLVGTPDYMLPEQVSGLAYDGRADVYSVGVMFYRMLSGKHPLDDTRGLSPYMVALRHLTTAPRPLESVAPDAPARRRARAS